MFCTKCGKEITGEVKFCPFCGAELYTGVNTAPASEASAPYRETPPVNAGAVPASMQPVPMPRLRTGLAGGIVYTVLSMLLASPLSFLTGVLSIIFGGIATGKKNRGDADGARGHARAAKGLNITSLILLILWIAMIVLFCILCVKAYQQVAASGFFNDLTPEGLQQWLRGYGLDVDLHELEELFNEIPEGTFDVDWQFST